MDLLAVGAARPGSALCRRGASRFRLCFSHRNEKFPFRFLHQFTPREHSQFANSEYPCDNFCMIERLEQSVLVYLLLVLVIVGCLEKLGVGESKSVLMVLSFIGGYMAPKAAKQ